MSTPEPRDTRPPSAERISAFLRATYNSAADHFDDPPLSFWDHFGRRTVDLAGPRPGDLVLDVCCGTGASALPAAERVLPGGRVLGVDIADRLLEKARAKAARYGLTNLHFETGDLTHLEVDEASFDVTLCAFGVFFAMDLTGAVSALLRTLRPGGTLVLTTWGKRLLEPANTIYWDAVEAERPDLRPAQAPYERIAAPADLAALLSVAGGEAVHVETETFVQPLEPEDFWTIVLGSGHRMAVNAMSADAAERLRETVLRDMADEGVGEVVTDVTYGRAQRPQR